MTREEVVEVLSERKKAIDAAALALVTTGEVVNTQEADIDRIEREPELLG